MPKADGNGLRKAARKRSWLPVRIERKIRSESGRFRGARRFGGENSPFYGLSGTGEMPRRRKRIARAFKYFGMRNSLSWRNPAEEGSVHLPPGVHGTRRKRLAALLQEALLLPEAEWPQRVRFGSRSADQRTGTTYGAAQKST